MNIIDVEDAWSTGIVTFQDWQADFMLEWNKPILQMLVNVDLAVNSDVYGGRYGSNTLQTQEEERPY